jgi:hypothetical protein
MESPGVTSPSLEEIDALVAKHVTGVLPVVYWEDSCSGFQYDDLEAALEGLHDPIILGLIPEETPTTAGIREVRVYPKYSSTVELALQVVDKLAPSVFRLQRSGAVWTASFGEHLACSAGSAPLAICLAALATKGRPVAL